MMKPIYEPKGNAKEYGDYALKTAHNRYWSWAADFSFSDR